MIEGHTDKHSSGILFLLSTYEIFPLALSITEKDKSYNSNFFH